MLPTLRHLILCLFAAVVLTLPPSSAKAGLSVAASLGFGGQVAPDHFYNATNIMIAPGYSLANIIRIELGLVGSLAGAQAQLHQFDPKGFDFELRPMLVINPPILPLYARLILAGVNLFSADRTVAYGGALGVGISLAGLGIFAEAGVLPRVIPSSNTFAWILEGRAGLQYSM